MLINDFIENELPSYIRNEDSYPDSEGRGFIFRYLGLLSAELDTNTVFKLEDFDQSVIDVNLADEKYLQYFETLQGNIVRFTEDEGIRRNVLKYIHHIYSIKGTKPSLRAAVASIGFKVTNITEHIPLSTRYDSASRYDDTTIRYDEECPPGCSEISITIERNSTDTITITDVERITRLIRLVLPVDVKVRNIFVGSNNLINLIKAVFLDTEPNSGISDPQGDLYYSEQDPLDQISLSLSDEGDLILTGANATQYSLNEDGDLIFNFEI